MIPLNPRRDLLLVGGGHTHALVLRMLAMRPPGDVRITLVSDTDFAPYSGMLPGLVAGHYDYRDAHIDLRHFCAARGVRFVEAAAIGVDAGQRRVMLSGRPPLEYDVLSINIGAQPELDSVPGAREYALPVKPVSGFYTRWLALERRLAAEKTGARIVIVGGGAGSAELALAMRYRLGQGVALELVCGDRLLGGYNRGARAAVRRRLESRGIGLREYSRVTEVSPHSLKIASGETVSFDELVWCTGVVPAGWLSRSGLPCDENGFVRVEDTLQISGFAELFAAGDCAVQSEHPRPRAGVFAVRQAPVLAENIKAVLAGRPLRNHRPQRRFLSLLSLGNKSAVADRGPLFASGAWVWRWKDRIDRKFMRQFSAPPPPMPSRPVEPEKARCGGCGAKLPASILREVLERLVTDYSAVVARDDLQEDAAVIPWSAGADLVQSVDSLRPLVDDPWQMGRITALHAFSDLYAMGARPESVQVHVCLPHGSPVLQRRELFQLMSGLVVELETAGATLVGGHSMEGSELSLGLTVNGRASQTPMSKRGARPGDQLVLTKPLGIGVIFAGVMASVTPGDVVAEAIASMLRSNRVAAELGRALDASACTDVTGFGLLGHLLEMVVDGETAAVLYTDRLPLLPGSRALSDAGIRSTLYPGNLGSLPADLVDGAEREPLLCDPQTSGGLLLALAPEKSRTLVDALAREGHPAAVIGEFTRHSGGPLVELRS